MTDDKNYPLALDCPKEKVVLITQEIINQAIDASRKSQVMLVIGTSSVVQPAASLALEATSGGAIVAEINLETTPHSHLMEFSLLGKAGEIVPKLLEGWE